MSNPYEDMSYKKVCTLLAEQVKVIEEAFKLAEAISDGSGVPFTLHLFDNPRTYNARLGWEEDTEWDSSSC